SGHCPQRSPTRVQLPLLPPRPHITGTHPLPHHLPHQRIHQTRRSLLTPLLKPTLQSPLSRRGNPRRHQPHRDIPLQLAQLLLHFEDLSTRPLYHPRVLLHRERLDNIRPRQLPDEQRFYRLIQPVGTPRHMPHRRPLVHAVTPVPPPGRIIPRRSAS